MKYFAIALFSSLLLVLSSCRAKAPKVEIEHKYPVTLTEAGLLAQPNLLGGIYAAYPGAPKDSLTPAPAGYEAFYVSNYNRHGSRYQPNDSRYVNTLKRLQDGHQRGVLTEYGESLIPRIQLLCDSCLGHGGQLSSVGVEQLVGIGARMGRNFREVFAQASCRVAEPRCAPSVPVWNQLTSIAFPSLNPMPWSRPTALIWPTSHSTVLR